MSTKTFFTSCDQLEYILSPCLIVLCGEMSLTLCHVTMSLYEVSWHAALCCVSLYNLYCYIIFHISHDAVIVSCCIICKLSNPSYLLMYLVHFQGYTYSVQVTRHCSINLIQNQWF